MRVRSASSSSPSEFGTRFEFLHPAFTSALTSDPIGTYLVQLTKVILVSFRIPQVVGGDNVVFEILSQVLAKQIFLQLLNTFSDPETIHNYLQRLDLKDSGETNVVKDNNLKVNARIMAIFKCLILFFLI